MATPKQTDPQFKLRFTPELRDQVEAAAKANNRTMNAEIVSRLERYASLQGETDALWEVARALAGAIDDACDTTNDPLAILINDAFDSVDEHGNFDRSGIRLRFGSEASKRLVSALRRTFQVRSDLYERIKNKAERSGRSVEDEVVSTLNREYPPAADVMHVHIANIREALDRYERETDPQARLGLQQLVEDLASAGHSMEINWDADE